MIKLLPLVMMITSCPYLSLAQSSSMLMGARAQSMGYSSACLADEWSIFNNVAGVSEIKKATVACTYDAMLSFPGFNKAAFALTLPYEVATSLGFFRFGNDVYQEQLLSVGISEEWGITSIGVKVNYIRYSLSGIGDKSLVSVSMGGMTKITPWLCVGAHIININQPFISHVDDERIPTVLIAGVLINLSKKLILATELEKDIGYNATLKCGMEYTLNKRFLVRTGFNLHPQSGFFGLGFKLRRYEANYSLQFIPLFGTRHQASVSYTFQKRRS